MDDDRWVWNDHDNTWTCTACDTTHYDPCWHSYPGGGWPCPEYCVNCPPEEEL